ncbi:hypothetical protein [Legionella cincinnatiensis]|uniref:Ribbon-helix-helix protein CopG domain-containing protein n=1 Tax=Legionella cincinnatiensis TaxID=28085 RepID=A0A378ILD6_9GAMM|nr:hypothetical protein [Legionella cincinnatiensis]KTC78733.1 hypothetical protein Lcin_3348 [Legionella cincinnatiensis]STX35321.1 Uncharacterised protein [Legionella cincinnatiensis]
MKKNIRLSLDVSAELNNALDEIVKETHSTKSEVLRKSIALLEMAVREKKEGNHLGVFDGKNKIVKEIIGF